MHTCSTEFVEFQRVNILIVTQEYAIEIRTGGVIDRINQQPFRNIYKTIRKEGRKCFI